MTISGTFIVNKLRKRPLLEGQSGRAIANKTYHHNAVKLLYSDLCISRDTTNAPPVAGVIWLGRPNRCPPATQRMRDTRLTIACEDNIEPMLTSKHATVG